MVNPKERQTPLSNLEIVGYADVFGKWALPRIVPPIFSLRDRQENFPILFTPFEIREDYVLGGTTGCRSEFDEMVIQKKVTQIDPAILAKPGHELWIDENFETKYGPWNEVGDLLLSKAVEYCEIAGEHLARGELDKADGLYGRALNAAAYYYESAAGEIAIRTIQGEAGKVEVWKDLSTHREDEEPLIDRDKNPKTLTDVISRSKELIALSKR